MGPHYPVAFQFLFNLQDVFLHNSYIERTTGYLGTLNVWRNIFQLFWMGDEFSARIQYYKI